MTTFFARVELHNASSANYDKLHEEMYKIGFYRIVVDPSPKNNHIQLPPGSYASYTAGEIGAVSLSIRTIANSITTLNRVYCAKVEDERLFLDTF